MKAYMKNTAAIIFLILCLPYTITLLVNGRQGIHQEEKLPVMEYQVLYELLRQDLSWMEDETLELMAVLYRTEAVRSQAAFVVDELSFEVYGEEYDRLLRAVENTRGQVVQIDGEYSPLPYHAVSAGRTRDGRLLGEEYLYVTSMECQEDICSEAYLKICCLTEAEMREALGRDIIFDKFELERDESGYVTRVSCGERSWTGERFRALLHLPSSCFWIDFSGNTVRVTVKGSGHGFGISLYTANCMAKAGADYREIIQKFYKDAECITIA